MAILCKESKHVDKSHLKPKIAVVIYEDGHGFASTATRHSITRQNTLSLGRVISLPTILNEMSELVSNQCGQKSILPEKVLLDSEQKIVWYTRRNVAPMWFRSENGALSFRVEWPPLFWVVSKSNRSLKVFALPTSSRPTDNTKLYHAPLMNVSEDGVVCQGTAKLPEHIGVSTLGLCEDVIYDSQFTHVNHDVTWRNGASNLEHMDSWRKRAAVDGLKPKRVLVRDLSDTRLRVKHILKGGR